MGTIVKSIKRAYSILLERNWDKVYWCIDLHGVCLKSTYNENDNVFYNDDVLKTLQLISSLPESVIILWSSCHYDEQSRVRQLFNDNDINVKYFNENPEISNTLTGDFTYKFYFSVLLDDKAGFDPDEDWELIYKYLKNK